MDFGTTLIAGLSIVLGVGLPVALAALIIWHKSRQARLVHETALKLAEKGQPVPPELFMTASEPFSDLRRGVVLLALGLGLALFMYQMDKPWSLGLIPAFMGLGYLVVWKIEAGKPAGPGR